VKEDSTYYSFLNTIFHGYYCRSLQGAAERLVFSRPLRERASIGQYWYQNANDLVEQAKRSGSAGTRCWTAKRLVFVSERGG